METKTCSYCGETFERKRYESYENYARRRFCGRSCAAHGRNQLNAYTPKQAPRERPVETKVCAVCGNTFTRHGTMSNFNWAKRLCCSKSCGARFRRTRIQGERVLASRCECGNHTVGVVWIIQGDARGLLWRQCVEVCDDCRDMWLQDGATLEPPPVVNEEKRPSQPSYFAPAHFANDYRSR